MRLIWPPNMIPCPFCQREHPVKEAESNNEDTSYAYADCPDVGEVRVTYEFQDRFKRITEMAIVA